MNSTFDSTPFYKILFTIGLGSISFFFHSTSSSLAKTNTWIKSTKV
ncbi:hypothetical protein LEP1GSC137_0280 [Leptospira borgpetersenii str. Noumea 25]|nr:hypothetical protein LEP1GSC137_0280 [Leptospira borgpetersenii str. Noumea 25]